MNSTTHNLSGLRAIVQRHVPELIAIRHDLHAHPELGYNEHRTAGVVQRELENAGVECASGLAGGTGVLGHLPGGGSAASDGAIGLRADMDALPITEQTGLAYASTNPGVMHACGHDGHTTILIGAARVLAELAQVQELPQPVTFVFQPAEEGGAGGKAMVDDGCLDGSVLGPPMQYMFGLHGWPQLRAGTVATRPGPMLAAADAFDIVVRGRGGHAAYPQRTSDPIVAASGIIMAAQQIVARNVGPLESAVVSFTQFHAGTTHNVIPNEVKLNGTNRTLTPEMRTLVHRRIGEVAQHVARAHGCEAAIEIHEGYPVTANDPAAVDRFNAVARGAFGDDAVLHMEQPVLGAEDFAYYCQKVPSCFFALGLLAEGRESMPDLHQATFNFNDDAIAMGVEMFCRLALEAGVRSEQ